MIANKKLIEKLNKEFNTKIECFDEKSIYKYSPVFLTESSGKKTILKTTKTKQDAASALFKWEQHLNDNNVGCVVPQKNENNEIITCIDDDKRWILYPYIMGEKYNGSLTHIKNAGRLLGKMHKAGESKRFFSNRFQFEIFDEDFVGEVNNDIQLILKRYENSVKADKLISFQSRMNEYISKDYDFLHEKELPYVDCTWDYKGTNLVYSQDSHPTVIDPDNGGYIPRIVDLALALILFNTDIESVPSRMFVDKEWEAFKSGYYEYIELSQVEIDVWYDVLKVVFLDEALWAIVDMEHDESIRQKEFIKSLLDFKSQDYLL